MDDKIKNIASKDIKEISNEELRETISWLKENIGDKEKISLLLKLNPQAIIIFRVLSNLTRHSFSRKLSINFASLEKAEKRDKIRIETIKSWSEKISKFFQSNPIDWDIEKFCKNWEEKKKKNFEDFDTQLFSRLKEEFEKLNLPNDLRKCDIEEFARVFHWLKEKIEEIGVCEELLKVDSQLLFILRISLGLSQKEFATKIGKTFRWVRDIDSKRNFLEDPQTLRRVVEKLSQLPIMDVNEEVAAATWMRFKLAAHERMREFNKKSLTEFEREDIERLFDVVKEKTNDFSFVPLELLMELPSSILIFRLGLGLGIRKFSLVAGINERWLRKIESNQGGMSLKNAIKMKEILENILKEKKIEKESVINNFIRFKNFIASPVNNETGIRLVENAPPTEEEKLIMEVLQKAGIEFQLHSTLKLHTGKFVNVDFLIRKNRNVFVIEVFKLSKTGRIATARISEIDHKFRGLKIVNPELKTIMVISSNEKEFSRIIAEKARAESFDTDFIFTIDELEKLLEVIT